MMDLYLDDPDALVFDAVPLQHHVGDLVVFMGGAYVIAAILDLAQPLYTDWPTGPYFALRNYAWPRALNLIVPALAIERPQHLVA